MRLPTGIAGLTTTLWLALGAAASAGCLTETDLARGVTVFYEGGDTTTIRRMADGYQQIDETYAGEATAMRFRAHRGIYFVEEVRLSPHGRPEPETRLEIAFETDPSRLPDPLPGVTWQGPSVNVFPDGGIRNEVSTVSFARGEPLVLPDCTYRAIATEIRYDWGPEGALTLDYLFLPDLGTAIYMATRYDGEEAYHSTPVAIEQARK